MTEADARATHKRSGPLVDVRVVEIASSGSVAYAGLLLADMGADLVRIDQRGVPRSMVDIASRGKRSVVCDLESASGRRMALDLCSRADALIEGHRPGAMEHFGLGPDALLARQPKLVYGRLPPWAQGASRRKGGEPMPPLNSAVGPGWDAMSLINGVLAALLEAQRSGTGQVVECGSRGGDPSLAASFEAGGVIPSAAARSFSRTPCGVDGRAPRVGEHTESVLRDWVCGARADWPVSRL